MIFQLLANETPTINLVNRFSWGAEFTLFEPLIVFKMSVKLVKSNSLNLM